MRLSEVLENLCLAIRADGATKESVVSYRRKMKGVIDFLGDAEIEGVSVTDLRRYIAYLRDKRVKWEYHPRLEPQKEGLSKFTIAGHIKSIKRVWNFAEQEGIITENVARRIKTPAPKREKPKGISQEDFEALLRTTEGGSVTDLRDKAILLFLRDTGARVGGLCGLTVDDVDLAEGLAVLREKGSKVRIVPFSPLTAQAIADWLEVRPTDQGDWLFITLANRASGGLTGNGVRHVLKQRAKAAGVTGPHNPHSFRHAFARDFLMSGGDLATLSRILGHSSVEITVRFYAIFSTAELAAKHRLHSPVSRMMHEGEDDGTE